MKTNLVIAALAVVVTLTSCGKDGLCIKGSGSTVSETRELNSFNKITLDGSADIYLTQDSVQSVVVEGQSNILDVLETKVSGDHLCIGFDKHCVMKHDPVKIYITVPDIEEFKLNGSGNVFGNGLISADHLSFKIDGSGNIEMQDLHVNQLETKISGSGDINYHGSGIVDYHSIDINGSGKIKAFELPTNTVDIDIDGSGDCKVHAIQQLNVNISGSGDVYYIGNPSITSHISGSGDIINAN